VTRVVLGVDPGMKGAIAVIGLDTLALAGVVDMPVAGNEVAVPLLRDVTRLEREGATIVGVGIERVASMPEQGVSTMFKFGVNYGIVRGFFEAHWPVALITPPTWKATFTLNGKDKDEARLLAIRRWPNQAGLFARKKDGGRADAALIGLHHAMTGSFGAATSTSEVA